MTEPNIPKPRARLIRTWLKSARNVRRFAPRISFEESAASMPDPSVAAHFGQAVLLTDAITALHRDGTVTKLFHVIAMLHGDRDLADYDDVVRPYNHKNSLHTIQQAVVHLPDGGQRKAKRIRENVNAKTKAIGLTFYPLRPNVIVELEEQNDRFVPYETGPSVWDQMLLGGPPCQRMRYTLAIAEPFNADYKLHHADWEPRKWMQSGYRVLQWDLRDLPGIELDEFTPNLRDFVPWVDVSSLKTWTGVGRHYLKELDPPRTIPEQLKRTTQEITADAKSDREKLAAVYHYAARDVRYGRHPLELEVEAPRQAESMLEDLRGDCKDKSALMVAMLRELDIKAYIVLVLTRMNGSVVYLPGMRFDHAIVKATVDGQDVWLDPAGGLCSFGDLPFNDQGAQILRLDADGCEVGTSPLPTAESHLIERDCRGQVTAEGKYSIDVEVKLTGEVAAGLRTEMTDRSREHQQRVLAQFAAGELPGAQVSEQEFVSLADLTQPVRVKYRIELDRWVRSIEDLLLFRVPWSEVLRMMGPMSAAERVQPLQAGRIGLSIERHELSVPSGYEPYGLPYDDHAECDWGRYSRSIKVENGKVICERRFESFDGIIPAERFTEYKRFWEAGAQADSADVVLWSRRT